MSLTKWFRSIREQRRSEDQHKNSFFMREFDRREGIIDGEHNSSKHNKRLHVKRPEIGSCPKSHETSMLKEASEQY